MGTASRLGREASRWRTWQATLGSCHRMDPQLRASLDQPHPVSSINEGDDNLGVILHDFSHHRVKKKRRLIIEKSTPYRFEYRLWKRLYHQQQGPRSSPLLTIFPKSYGVALSRHRFRTHYHLFMECLPDSVCSKSITTAMLEELALCSIRLHSILPELTAGFQRPPRRRILTRSNYAWLQRLFPETASSPVPKLTKIDRVLSQLPLAFAHTDLSWRNVRMHKTQRGLIAKVFDLAWARQLPMGVEWHHFASGACSSPSDVRLFHSITHYYASLLGLAPGHVRACSSLFALHVALICRLGPKGHEPITAEQAEAGRQDAWAFTGQALEALPGILRA